MSTDQRYAIVKGSQSAHCCFEATVVDTSKRVMIRGEPYFNRRGFPQYEPVCECFDEATANMVCDALNADNYYTALGLLADIRGALGDPVGKLMQRDLVDMAAKIKAQRDSALELLRTLEWSVSSHHVTGNDTTSCPSCGAHALIGLPGTHNPGCALAAILEAS